MNIEEARKFVEPGFENRNVALSILNRSLFINNAKAPLVRDKPCSDCAVMDGLASCCYRYLNHNEKEAVIER